MKENLVLTGMPGAGKSTIGVLAAKALGMAFLDTDLELMQKTGHRLQEILDSEGLAAFLDIENNIVCGIHPKQTVIATGGSVVLEEEAMVHLQRIASIIFLDVSYEELERRITNMKSRGIAFVPGQTLKDIYKERRPLYQRYADLSIYAGGDMETVVEAVVKGFLLKNV